MLVVIEDLIRRTGIQRWHGIYAGKNIFYLPGQHATPTPRLQLLQTLFQRFLNRLGNGLAGFLGNLSGQALGRFVLYA